MAEKILAAVVMFILKVTGMLYLQNLFKITKSISTELRSDGS